MTIVDIVDYEHILKQIAPGAVLRPGRSNTGEVVASFGVSVSIDHSYRAASPEHAEEIVRHIVQLASKSRDATKYALANGGAG